MIVALLILIVFVTKDKDEPLSSQPLLPKTFTGIALLYDASQGQCNKTDGCKELWELIDKLQKKYPNNVAAGDSNKPNYHFELAQRGVPNMKMPAIVGFRNGKFDSVYPPPDVTMATVEPYLLSMLEP